MLTKFRRKKKNRISGDYNNTLSLKTKINNKMLNWINGS